MAQFTVAELESALTELEEQMNLDDSLFMNLYYDGKYGSGDKDEMEVPGIGKIEYVESWGGEGDGAGIYVVIKIGDRYFQKSGYYSSWDSSEMDGELVEVKPKQVEVTRYEEV